MLLKSYNKNVKIIASDIDFLGDLNLKLKEVIFTWAIISTNALIHLFHVFTL